MARMSRLSEPQRVAIRAIHDASPEKPLGNTPVTKQTTAALVRRGLIEFRSADEAPRVGWYLTEAGQREYDLIMESGDGPEALKSMLRF